VKPFAKFCLYGITLAAIGISLVWYGVTSRAGIFSLVAFGLGFLCSIAGVMIPVLASIKFKEEKPGRLRTRE
jgi:ABC-type transport system involved in multi-copper enzyme maturation permease subunit